MFNKLNNPFKRIMFIIFLVSASVLIVRSLFPAPFEIHYYKTWEDKASKFEHKRQVTWVNTDCTLTHSTSPEKLYLDMLALKLLVDKGRVSDFVNGEELNTKPTDRKIKFFSFTKNEKQDWVALLTDDQHLCTHGYCVELLTAPLFSKLFNLCGEQKTEYQVKDWSLDINLADNLFHGGVITLWAFVIMIFSALGSVLYDATLGKLLRWLFMKD